MNLAPAVELSSARAVYSNGVRGVRQTLAMMRKLVNEGRTNLSVRNAAVGVIFNTPSKDEFSEASALYEFVRDHVRYVKDINGVETLCSAEKTLATRIGDCDDQTTLLAAMFEAVGYPTRFCVAGYNEPELLEHVYCQVFIDGDWLDCDPTEPAFLGWAPPDPVTLYYEQV
jgi:hypothetical protein